MSMNPSALATARRNLAQRIARFLDTLDGASRNPNSVEGSFVLSALGHLAVDLWPEGERAMLKAERAGGTSPRDIANVHASYRPVTTRELRAELEKILQSTN